MPTPVQRAPKGLLYRPVGPGALAAGTAIRQKKAVRRQEEAPLRLQASRGDESVLENCSVEDKRRRSDYERKLAEFETLCRQQSLPDQPMTPDYLDSKCVDGCAKDAGDKSKAAL